MKHVSEMELQMKGDAGYERLHRFRFSLSSNRISVMKINISITRRNIQTPGMFNLPIRQKKVAPLFALITW